VTVLERYAALDEFLADALGKTYPAKLIAAERGFFRPKVAA
jgi:hypothetical protein